MIDETKRAWIFTVDIDGKSLYVSGAITDDANVISCVAHTSRERYPTWYMHNDSLVNWMEIMYYAGYRLIARPENHNPGYCIGNTLYKDGVYYGEIINFWHDGVVLNTIWRNREGLDQHIMLRYSEVMQYHVEKTKRVI